MKEKYTGRTLAELRTGNIKAADLSVQEMELLGMIKTGNNDNTPGAVSRFVRGTFMTLKAGGRGIATAASKGVDTIHNAIVEQELVDKLATSRDIYYKRGMAKLALGAGDLDQNEYEAQMSDLDEQEAELNK